MCMNNKKVLVDVNQLLDAFLKRYTERERNHQLMFAACEIKQDFADMICEATPVDAVEVVHGRWISDGLGDGERICSVCRRYALYTHRSRYDQYLTACCPSCGAKMDVKED